MEGGGETLEERLHKAAGGGDLVELNHITLEERLHKAAVGGDLVELNHILREDPMILAQIKVGCSIHTPLHVAAFRGHLEFVKKILQESPELAGVLDSRRWSPLHLASARDHHQIVRALVLVNPNMCTSLDGDARNPLHLAAMNGNLQALKEILEVCFYECHELMNAKDVAGNTILHLAVKHKRFEIVKYLIEKINKAVYTKFPIKAVNAINNCGYTALDILLESEEGWPDLKEIKRSFRKAEAVTAKVLSQGEWLSKKRETLMVVASLLATMAFQAGLNPPGGFWQDNNDSNDPHRAGEAIMAHNYPDTYPFYLRANTIGFVASASTILLLITGWPFKKRLFMWFLVVIMWVTITSMAFTYAFSIVVVTPKKEREPLTHTIIVGVIVWCSVMVALFVVHVIRNIYWWLKINKDKNKWQLIKNFFKFNSCRHGWCNRNI